MSQSINDLTREDMLNYLLVYGNCAPSYYEKLDEEKLKREYMDATKA